VAEIISGLRADKNHQFWPDDISLLDNPAIDVSRLLHAARTTDTYLLALASAHKGKLATFDRRLITDAVIGGRKALHVIS
jgi:predicted nucleic acid-binding protein